MAKKKKQADKNKKKFDYVPSEISTTRYTFDMWMKCYPESNREEWENITCPNSLLDFVICVAERNKQVFEKSVEHVPIRVTVIDDEYFRWLGDRENTTLERANYARFVSDDDVVRLSEKHKMNYSYTVCLYPVFLTPGEAATSRRRILSSETRNQFGSYIKQIMPDLDIYVAPYCMEMRHAANQEDQLVDMAKSFFDNGKEIEHRSWMRVYNEEPGSFKLYGIPIIFRETHDTMKFVPDNIFDDEHELTRGMDYMAMTQEYFDDFGIKGVVPFENTELPTAIQKDLKIMWPLDSFADYFVAVWDVDEYYQDMEDYVFDDDEKEKHKSTKKHRANRFH